MTYCIWLIRTFSEKDYECLITSLLKLKNSSWLWVLVKSCSRVFQHQRIKEYQNLISFIWRMEFVWKDSQQKYLVLNWRWKNKLLDKWDIEWIWESIIQDHTSFAIWNILADVYQGRFLLVQHRTWPGILAFEPRQDMRNYKERHKEQERHWTSHYGRFLKQSIEDANRSCTSFWANSILDPQQQGHEDEQN